VRPARPKESAALTLILDAAKGRPVFSRDSLQANAAHRTTAAMRGHCYRMGWRSKAAKASDPSLACWLRLHARRHRELLGMAIPMAVNTTSSHRAGLPRRASTFFIEFLGTAGPAVGICFTLLVSGGTVKTFKTHPCGTEAQDRCQKKRTDPVRAP